MTAQRFLPLVTTRATLILMLAVLTLCSCHKIPKLVDTLGTTIDHLEDLCPGHDPRELAPIIIVGSVTRNDVIAKHVASARYDGVYLDLHAVHLLRENTLKGDLSLPELTFFYFAAGRYRDSKPNPRYKRLFSAEPGSRYLFFLTEDHGVLRSIGDVGDYTIMVSSGAHPEQPEKGESPGDAIAKILLTPGSDANFDLMANKLGDYSRVVDIWSSRLRAALLLQKLTLLSEPLRSYACSVLAQSYPGQDDCERRIAEDPRESGETRRVAMMEMKEQTAQRLQLLKSLNDPASMSYLQVYNDSRRRVREELETILVGSDSELRERACTALRRYYPHEDEPGCLGTVHAQSAK